MKGLILAKNDQNLQQTLNQVLFPVTPGQGGKAIFPEPENSPGYWDLMSLQNDGNSPLQIAKS